MVTSSRLDANPSAKIGTLQAMNLDARSPAQNNAPTGGSENGNVPFAQPVTLPVSPEILELEDAMELEIQVEPEGIVEAAEQLLREGAPHDFDVVVIGAGPGGIAAALGCARGGLHTALVEEREIGGTALNRGGIGSKSLLQSVEVLRQVRDAKQFGIEVSGEVSPDFGAMQGRKNEIIARLRADATRELENAGVEILVGQAHFVEAHTLDIAAPGTETRCVSAIHIVIAVGGVPARIEVEGAYLPGVVTSDEILEQNFVPVRLIIAGAGAIGIEFATIFAALGAQVTILEKSSAVLPSEDGNIQKACRASLEKQGIAVKTGAEIQKIDLQLQVAGFEGEATLQVAFLQNDELQLVPADQVLLATARRCNWDALRLENAGISVESGKIEVDEIRQTSVSGVYAIGDCVRRVGWANQAAMEGNEVAATLLGIGAQTESRFVPVCYFTHPEMATVGLSLDAAADLGIEAGAEKFAFLDCRRAAIGGETGGFVKIVFEAGTERLLGCQIIGPRASELINEMALALSLGATVSALVATLHAYPTLGEALQGAASAAQQAPRGAFDGETPAQS
ncbi:NADPH-glutathione reductase [Abditibacterium utsteinense]|uniref:NADPH-glutathione reductase n=1 Tax=Abditibacterium utsteinense TaxID=1960156 RepID=A0A2S8SX85_9BACT|nr:NAD(P)/FAD-dependent oxidoreductase [Abditibacterium utsteinense]PQV65404.1 NADPH-glutathione reductase [Abditibacterium utsteinense]